MEGKDLGRWIKANKKLWLNGLSRLRANGVLEPVKPTHLDLIDPTVEQRINGRLRQAITGPDLPDDHTGAVMLR
jgi:hypothetical protein